MRSPCTSRMLLRRVGLLPMLLTSACLMACAATSSFDGSLYRGQYASFRLSPTPATWKRVALPAADLAFRDLAHEGSILVNSRCTTADRDAPLLSLTEHLIIGTTDRRITREETVPFDAREARHTLLRARLDGVPMEYDIFVLKKDGCVFDLVYVAPPDAAGGGAADFEQFVRGFHTVPSAG
jgi:hypothetical protein